MAHGLAVTADQFGAAKLVEHRQSVRGEGVADGDIQTRDFGGIGIPGARAQNALAQIGRVGRAFIGKQFNSRVVADFAQSRVNAVG